MASIRHLLVRVVYPMMRTVQTWMLTSQIGIALRNGLSKNKRRRKMAMDLFNADCLFASSVVCLIISVVFTVLFMNHEYYAMDDNHTHTQSGNVVSLHFEDVLMDDDRSSEIALMNAHFAEQTSELSIGDHIWISSQSQALAKQRGMVEDRVTHNDDDDAYSTQMDYLLIRLLDCWAILHGNCVFNLTSQVTDFKVEQRRESEETTTQMNEDWVRREMEELRERTRVIQSEVVDQHSQLAGMHHWVESLLSNTSEMHERSEFHTREMHRLKQRMEEMTEQWHKNHTESMREVQQRTDQRSGWLLKSVQNSLDELEGRIQGLKEGDEEEGGNHTTDGDSDGDDSDRISLIYRVIQHSPMMRRKNDLLSRVAHWLFAWLFGEVVDQRSIQASVRPGDCTPLRQPSGEGYSFIIVQLHQSAVIHEVSLSHFTIHPDYYQSSPHEFELLASNDRIHWNMIGLFEFDYQNHNHDHQQSFPIQLSNPDDHFEFIAFRFLSNHGHLNYTCIYNIYVFGSFL